MKTPRSPQKSWFKKNLPLLGVALLVPAAIIGVVEIYQKILNAIRPPFHSNLIEVPDVPNMTVRYGGSTSFAPLGKGNEMSQKIQQFHPGFKLTYTKPLNGKNPGSSIGISMLLNDSLDFALASRSLETEEYDDAKGKRFSLEQKKVAYDGIAFYVNRNLHLANYPNIPLPGLTISKLKGILTGEITNWKDVGGTDLPIVIFSRNPKSGGTPQYVQENVMEKKKFAPSVRFEENTTQSIRLVAETPGGIGYATASEVCNQDSIGSLPIVRDEKQEFVSPCTKDQSTNDVNITVFDNGTYPITRPMFVIIKRDNGFSEKAGIAYVNLLLSKEGQKIIKRAGLAPVHGER